jgi:aspartate dehydrogenase
MGFVKTLDDFDSPDIVVEAAGQAAVREYAKEIVTRGIDLLVLSVGALVDDGFRKSLWSSGGGRVLLSTGAIGGLDLLRAAFLMGRLNEVSLESTKSPEALVQPWMDDEFARRVRNARGQFEVFRGTAREASTLFPSSANIAATLGLATVGLDETRVAMRSLAGIDRVRHQIRASGSAGEYEFSIQNTPTETNPRTSAVTAFAVVRALLDRGSHVVMGA